MKIYHNDDIEIDDDEVLGEVAKKFSPEDVFTKYDLEDWAESNGYVKEEEELI